jgi:para-nitrobenzyl esterase
MMILRFPLIVALILLSVVTTGDELSERVLRGIKYGEAARWAHANERPFDDQQAYNQLPPRCPQRLGAEIVGDEDCLYLNVISPGGAKNAPVLVWFHGGGFVGGYSGDWISRFNRFTQAGIVVVIPNYRLGRLGNVSTDFAQGNFALGDMQVALQWVQHNVGLLGGDPNNVTIMGQSAGGMAVQMLMASEASSGLFSRAISQSGYGSWPMPNTAEQVDPVKQGDAIEDLIASVDGFLIPYIDGQLLRASPAEIFQRGEQVSVPLLMGSNSFDGSVMPYSGVDRASLRSLLNDSKQEVVDTYFNETNDGELATQLLFGDLRYGLPSLRLGSAHTQAGNKTYLYYFDYLPSGLEAMLLGSPHGLELATIMGYQPGWLPPSMPVHDSELGKSMAAAWIAFIKEGAPCSEQLCLQLNEDTLLINSLGRTNRLESFVARLRLIDASMH